MVDICWDEFPYMVKSCPSLPSVLQKLLKYISPFEWRHSAERYCGGEPLLQQDCGGKLTSDYYLNAIHRANSMAAQREMASMLLHPYSREQKLQQINSLRQKSVSKESANEQRRKLPELALDRITLHNTLHNANIGRAYTRQKQALKNS